MDESGDRVRLTDLQDLKIVSSEDDSFFPSNIRSQILEQIRQSDGDFCDYNSAFSLILSLCQVLFEEKKKILVLQTKKRIFHSSPGRGKKRSTMCS